MEVKDKFIQTVRPYLEKVIKTYKTEESFYPSITEKGSIVFGKGLEEYDLILDMGNNNELGFRCSGHEHKIHFSAWAYLSFFERGKWYKSLKFVDNYILTEKNIKKTINKFLEVYGEQKTKKER